jgi:hypothetical protein
MSQSIHPSASFLHFALILTIPLMFIYKKYLRIKITPAFGVVIVAIVLAVLVITRMIRNGHIPHNEEVTVILGAFVFFASAVPFIVRLVRAWLFDDLKPEERLGGAEGARAWLSGGNLVCLIAIPITGYLGLGYSPWALALVCLLALVARPLLTGSGVVSAEPAMAAEVPKVDTLKAERERVLRMLEEGTIKADDASDLLSALAATNPSPTMEKSTKSPLSSKQRIAFVGGLLLLVGVVLPWFSINLGQELNRISGQFGEMMPGVTTGSMSVNGANVDDGLGWFVTLGGIFAALLIALPDLMRDAERRRMVVLGCLAVGGVLLVYLVGSNLRHVTFGIIVVIAGYVCVGIGAGETLQKGGNISVG